MILMDNVIIIKFGEVALRGSNRYILENRLIEAIRRNIRPFPEYRVTREIGRYIVERADGGDFDADAIIPRVSVVFGLVGLSPALRSRDTGIAALREAALISAREALAENPAARTFKVAATRAHKTYPLRSQEICADTGGFILENIPRLKVDVKNPDITVKIELRNYAYIYSRFIPGLGGLPPESCGRALTLLSAGIDSPVASYLTARRGAYVESVYFHSPPHTSERALQKVLDVCERLAVYTGGYKLSVVNITPTHTRLLERTPPEKFTILLKRSMLRAAELLAAKNGCDALVTGDSLGQVASQTIKSMAAIDHGLNLPVLRPLLGFDKREITDLAVKIGTYDVSIRPFEDCCTLFVARHPETKPKVSIIESIERNMPDLPQFWLEAAEKAETYEF
jgi:thiamine biosynthesis protein ThiI